MTFYNGLVGGNSSFRAILSTTASTVIVPEDQKARAIGKVTIANVTASAATADLEIFNTETSVITYVFKGVPVPPNGLPLEFRDDNLARGDQLRVKASIANALHVTALVAFAIG